jgi:hypothetical protein
MDVYNYHPKNFDFVWKDLAAPSPLEPGVFLFPAFSTTIAPPDTAKNERAVFDPVLKIWRVEPDFRGKRYQTATGREIDVTKIGPLETVAPETTALKPPEFQLGYKTVWTGDAWEQEALPPQMPTSITMRQARLALLGAGLLDAVTAAVAAMPEVAGQAARIEWEYATTVERSSSLIASLTDALGLDDAAIDALFMTASTL